MGVEELLIVARVAAAMCYAIVVACLWHMFRQRSTLRDALGLRHLLAGRRMLETLRRRWCAAPDAHTRKVHEVMRRMKEDRCARFMPYVVGWSVATVSLGIYQMHAASLWSDDVDVDRMRAALTERPLLRQI